MPAPIKTAQIALMPAAIQMLVLLTFFFPEEADPRDR
jgi:hypothetical protein